MEFFSAATRGIRRIRPEPFSHAEDDTRHVSHVQVLEGRPPVIQWWRELNRARFARRGAEHADGDGEDDGSRTERFSHAAVRSGHVDRGTAAAPFHARHHRRKPHAIAEERRQGARHSTVSAQHASNALIGGIPAGVPVLREHAGTDALRIGGVKPFDEPLREQAVTRQASTPRVLRQTIRERSIAAAGCQTPHHAIEALPVVVGFYQPSSSLLPSAAGDVDGRKRREFRRFAMDELRAKLDAILDGMDASADALPRLDHEHVEPVRMQVAGGGETSDPRANDNDVLSLRHEKAERQRTRRIVAQNGSKRQILRMPNPRLFLALLAALGTRAHAQSLDADIGRRVDQVMPKVVAWRRDIHQNPELSNREVRTAKLVADHLRALGLEVQTGVATNGVVAVLRGGRPGGIVALRADMDALPVTEQTNVPFKSTVRTMYNGQDAGVMHACGHDMHTAMLMGAAEVLAGMKAQIPGTVKFIFQGAEEGPPAGEKGGAKQMLAEGVFATLKPDAIFGLHVGVTNAEAGHLTYKPLGFMAAADFFTVTVRGKQVHGATPWAGVDPLVAASQIVLGLQTVVSRQMDITNSPVVVTVGSIQGGIRNNIIPDSVVMLGTIRTFDPEMRKDVQARVKRTAEQIAAASGATATVTIDERTPVTSNDPTLTDRMVPTLRRVAGPANVSLGRPVTGAEDFGDFANQVPGLFVFLGIRPKGSPPSAFVSNHSPLFFADEAALPVGVKTLVTLATDYLSSPR
jgi:amidohydrolase